LQMDSARTIGTDRTRLRNARSGLGGRCNALTPRPVVRSSTKLCHSSGSCLTKRELALPIQSRRTSDTWPRRPRRLVGHETACRSAAVACSLAECESQSSTQHPTRGLPREAHQVIGFLTRFNTNCHRGNKLRWRTIAVTEPAPIDYDFKTRVTGSFGSPRQRCVGAGSTHLFGCSIPIPQVMLLPRILYE